VAGRQVLRLPAAYKIAERLGPGKRIVTIFPDGAERYQSRGFLTDESVYRLRLTNSNLQA